MGMEVCGVGLGTCRHSVGGLAARQDTLHEVRLDILVDSMVPLHCLDSSWELRRRNSVGAEDLIAASAHAGAGQGPHANPWRSSLIFQKSHSVRRDCSRSMW